MARLDRKQAKELIEAYLAQHPNATSSEIAKALGVSKQRAHQLLMLVRGADTPLKDHEFKILRYITVVLTKLKASNRTQAAILAMQRGLISLEDLKPAKTASK